MENFSGAVVNVGDNGTLAVKITTKDAVYSSHMPFIKGGGLFITTNRSYQLGDEVPLLLGFMDEVEQLPITGKVVWLTPSGAQGAMAAGIGVQLIGDNSPTVQKKMVTYIAGMIDSDRRTDTM